METDDDILADATHIINIIKSDPYAGIVLANAAMAMSESLVMAAQILEKSPDDEMANGIVGIAHTLGLVEMDDDDADEVTLAPAESFSKTLDDVQAVLGELQETGAIA